VGIATQDLKLRERFLGKPEALMAYLCFIAQEVRQRLATLGYRSLKEVVGRVELLRALDGADTGIDLTKVLANPDPQNERVRSAQAQCNELPRKATLDYLVFRDVHDTLKRKGKIRLQYDLENTDRSVGVRLAGAAAQCDGIEGLSDGAIECAFTGHAGGSFGAFVPKGISLTLSGVANDYVGKGLCGGQIVIAPHQECTYRQRAHEHTILGNTALYGATSGWLFAAGRSGERFAVRNSGAQAVVEGVGAHGCEYMTGGVAVILGRVGDNFAAGMTGGVAYVFDEDDVLSNRYNPELVTLSPLTHEDAGRLKHFIKQHQEKTNSTRATRMLKHWQTALPRFKKVIPLEEAATIEADNEGALGKRK